MIDFIEYPVFSDPDAEDIFFCSFDFYGTTGYRVFFQVFDFGIDPFSGPEVEVK